MKQINKCCGEHPTVYKGCMEDTLEECCRDCVELIQCDVCGRTIWGYGVEEIDSWNNGDDDED